MAYGIPVRYECYQEQPCLKGKKRSRVNPNAIKPEQISTTKSIRLHGKEIRTEVVNYDFLNLTDLPSDFSVDEPTNRTLVSPLFVKN
jgi:hypothetical protein